MPKCIIRGHDHELTHVRRIHQKGTGIPADTWECPTGMYRFFCIDGREPSRTLMFKRPRWGWPKGD